MLSKYSTALHSKQHEVFSDKTRFKVVCAGRRWGKCVRAGTLIAMENGSYKKIEDIFVGESVLSMNPSSHQIEPKIVTNIKFNGVRSLIRIKSRSGKFVDVTPNHPIFVNNKWTNAEDVNPKDLVALYKDGDVLWDEVLSVENVGEDETWDLEVSDNHNFISGDIITHNSLLSRTALLDKATEKSSRIVWYVAPTYRMAKQIMWDDMNRVLPEKWVKKRNETFMRIELINKSIIEMKGADSPDSLRGVGLDYLVMDEMQDMRPEVWKTVLRPTLATTNGEALFIGTAKGLDHFYDLWLRGMNPEIKSWKSWQFSTASSPFVPAEEIEQARNDMDPKTFRQEMEGSFEMTSGRVYHPFDRNIHVGNYEFNPKLPIYIGQDFNIDPMSSAIFQIQENGDIWAIDEIVLFSSNTQEVCEEIERRYWRYIKQIIIYPDPAGGARQHARGETDLDIFREKGFKRIRYHRKHPKVADRINSVNKMLMTANGEVRLRVNRKCRYLIDSFERVVYKEGCREVDKSLDIEHQTDAAGYFIEFEFPARRVEVAGVSL